LNKTIRQAVDDGDIHIMHAATLAKSKYAYLMDKDESNAYRSTRRCLWVYGKPGCGKSAWVRQEHKNLYYKTPDKWWDGYKGQSSVLLEDLDVSKARELVQMLKLWADKYDFSGEIKGGRVNMTYEAFIVTSNFLPNELWKESMLVEAITRRFEFFTTEILSFDPFFVNLMEYQI
jgi:hypothetical protein